MVNSNILIVASILTFCALFFIGLAIPEGQNIIKTGYEICFLAMIIGIVLRKKNIQQLIGLFFYLICFNLDLLKDEPFQIQNDNILRFARLNAFFVIVIASVFLFPTFFDKYQLAPLTNETDIQDRTIILTAISLTVLIQTTIRLAA